ncbi:hypothetical protein A0H81_11615 [Grifola frondosa]|uniref:Uncharacterized protein n=1 Tax=Grifola frondosa TaxID=5627 RepID=A0A1C7LUD6_GRIFR|nr:hypothetical protein A0H81_11615 [Grifola frondosa]
MSTAQCLARPGAFLFSHPHMVSVACPLPLAHPSPAQRSAQLTATTTLLWFRASLPAARADTPASQLLAFDLDIPTYPGMISSPSPT